jgi:ribosomal protein S18 acetylase RimI-like enzyme
MNPNYFGHMHFTIRYGVESDATALAELAARTFKETFGEGTGDEDMASYLAEAYGTPQQEQELVDPDITTLLIECDGILAGYAMVRSGTAPDCVTGESPLELWRFYIASGWHGRGLAQSLMQRVEIEAQQRGGRTLWLGVWEHNARARAFYSKCGFTDVGSHVFVVGSDPQTDRIMVRSLPSAQLDVHMIARN